MSLYDIYSQKYQFALAPAIDYLQRSQAASAIGLDYNKLSAQQVHQFFGQAQTYGYGAMGGAPNNSSLENLLYQATGGYNPYVQQLQTMQYQNVMYQNPYSLMNPSLGGYQLPQQPYFNPYMPNQFNAPILPPQPIAYNSAPYPNVQMDDIDQVLALLQGLEGSTRSNAEQYSDDENSGLTLFKQLFAKAVDKSNTYDADMLKKIEEKILEIRKEAASEDSKEA